MYFMLVTILQTNSETIEWSDEQAKTTMIMLAVLRQLLISTNNIDFFYFATPIFLDRLNSSDFFQAARDVAEEIIIASYKDKVPELGLINSYQCYSRQKSTNAAMLYANMALLILNYLGRPLKNKLAQKIIWESIRYFRNIKLFKLSIRIYESIPKEISFMPYERRAIDHTYFSCLIFTQEEMLPVLVLNYLNKEREEILRAGIQEAHPWLQILHNIKRLYPNADFSPTGLGFYLKTFESIVPKESRNKFTEIIYGDSENLKDYLKLSIIRLNETRSKSDFVNDNTKALTIANRLIARSFQDKDYEAILLAMMLKSDFSLIFQEKDSPYILPFALPENDLEKLQYCYGNHKDISESLSTSKSEIIVWLAVTEGDVFQLSFLSNEFHFSFLSSFDWQSFTNLQKSNFFSSLFFNDSVKDLFGVRDISPDEHLKQSREIQETLSFSKLAIPEDTDSVLIVKDMELAKFPHNLLLENNGSYIHLNRPIANILSTEWFVSAKKDSKINTNFSKSIWIPTDDGDLALNKLFDYLKPELDEQKFDIYNNTNISPPISSEFNIVCSHGSYDIASNQFISTGSKTLENLDRIIGLGEILIFFVCHSGSYNNDSFRNNITSIVKTYISQGYKAIIAPFWSLHITIPPIWLKHFLNALNIGNNINRAVFMANKHVRNKYPNPTAWACMHLYGNPYVSIRDNKSTDQYENT